MTVKELKEILNKFEDTDIVHACGGENQYGCFGELFIGGDCYLSEDEEDWMKDAFFYL